MTDPLPKIAHYPDAHWERAIGCGHWNLVMPDVPLDGCSKCRLTKMINKNDPHSPKRGY